MASAGLGLLALLALSACAWGQQMNTVTDIQRPPTSCETEYDCVNKGRCIHNWPEETEKEELARMLLPDFEPSDYWPVCQCTRLPDGRMPKGPRCEDVEILDLSVRTCNSDSDCGGAKEGGRCLFREDGFGYCICLRTRTGDRCQDSVNSDRIGQQVLGYPGGNVYGGANYWGYPNMGFQTQSPTGLPCPPGYEVIYLIGVANSNNLLPNTQNSQYQILSQLLAQLSPANTRNYLIQTPATMSTLQPSYQVISYLPKLNQGPIYIPQVHSTLGQQPQYNPQIYRQQIPYYQVQQPTYYQRQIHYQQPTNYQPVYQPPIYRQPVYQQSMYRQPVYQPPIYRQPVYQQPIYRQHVYQQPMYRQPVYQQPMYRQPVYQQSIYRQPVYQQPINYQVHRQPVYQQPTYYQPQFYQRYYNTPYYYQGYQPQGQMNPFGAPYNFYNRRAQVTVTYRWSAYQPPPYQIQPNYVQQPKPTYRPQYYQFPQITQPQVPYRPQTYYPQVQQQILRPQPYIQIPQYQYYPRTQQSSSGIPWSLYALGYSAQQPSLYQGVGYQPGLSYRALGNNPIYTTNNPPYSLYALQLLLGIGQGFGRTTGVYPPYGGAAFPGNVNTGNLGYNPIMGIRPGLTTYVGNVGSVQRPYYPPATYPNYRPPAPGVNPTPPQPTTTTMTYQYPQVPQSTFVGGTGYPMGYPMGGQYPSMGATVQTGYQTYNYNSPYAAALR